MKAIKKIASILPWALAVIAVAAAITVFVYVGNGGGSRVDYEAVNKATEEKETYEREVAGLRDEAASLRSKVDGLINEIDSKHSFDGQRWEMELKAKELERMIDAMPDDPSAVDIIAKNLFDIGRSLIKYMGDAEFRAHKFVEPEVEATKNGYRYFKCDISYSDAERLYSEIFTGTALKNFMSIRFTDVDGDLYAIPGGGSSGFGIEKVKLTRVDEANGEIKYKISYVHTFNGGHEDAGTCTMTIKPVNGTYRISEIDYLDDYWLSKELYWKVPTE